MVAGVLTKTRLESRMKKIKPHFISRATPRNAVPTTVVTTSCTGTDNSTAIATATGTGTVDTAGIPSAVMFKSLNVTSIPPVFKMVQYLDCDACLVGTRSTFGAGAPNQNTPRIQNKDKRLNAEWVSFAGVDPAMADFLFNMFAQGGPGGR